MDQPLKDSFLDLERHRKLLEENIEKLQKALKDWCTWEADYEGLKEDILALDDTPSQEQLNSIGRRYNGQLLTQKDVEDILGVKVNRTVDQISNVLSRRIDYVSRNVVTVEKQLEAAEKKLATAIIISAPDFRNEEGLPMTEIIEELDDEGNAISGRTETPETARPQLRELLEEAQVKDPLSADEETVSGKSEPKTKFSKKEPEFRVEARKVPLEGRRKSVQFAEGTKLGPETEKSQTAQRVEALSKPRSRHQSTPAEKPVIPLEESPEEASIRKEMLQYGMFEIGAVVAELDIEEGSDFSDEDSNDDDLSSMDDDEDAYGRSTRKVVDDDIRRRMLELERKLGLRTMKAEEHNPAITINGTTGTANGRDTENENPVSSNDSQATKKAVRFAQELDISNDISAAAERVLEAAKPKSQLPSKSPISDIVERAPPREPLATNATPPQKVSRFKSARAANIPNVQSTVPEQNIHNRTPSEPEEKEYTEEGEPKRVSRFKAARLGKA